FPLSAVPAPVARGGRRCGRPRRFSGTADRRGCADRREHSEHGDVRILSPGGPLLSAQGPVFAAEGRSLAAKCLRMSTFAYADRESAFPAAGAGMKGEERG